MNAEILTNEDLGQSSNVQDSERTSNIQLSTSNVEVTNGADVVTKDGEPTDSGRTLNIQLATSNGEQGKGEAKLEPNNGVQGSTSSGQGEFAPTEPWAEAVNGAELLDAIAAELRRFVVFGDWIGETFALWILHTHAYRLRQVTTYMGIESPEKECGKSTLLTALSRMVDRPAISANISASAFFHAVAQLQPTLLIDEADTNLRAKDDMTGILNSGYTKSTAFVWRMSYDGANGDQEQGGKTEGPVPGRVARYSCWCPKAIAGIGRLPATLASRCIVVQMHRKTRHEQCERLSRLDGVELKRKCARFVADHQAEIASAEPKIPKGLSNRSADIWEPLLVLADLAGGRWPELARKAALALTGKAEERSPIGALLLDLYLVFTAREAERLFSRDLIAGLMEFGDRPWYELTRGKPLTDATLARQLGKYGIRPRTLRIGKVVSRGYLKSDFSEICQRYIPRSELIALEREAEERDAADLEEKNGTDATNADFGSGI